MSRLSAFQPNRLFLPKLNARAKQTQPAVSESLCAPDRFINPQPVFTKNLADVFVAIATPEQTFGQCNFFASSTFVLDEFVGYGVSAMTFLALGMSYRAGALLRVDLLFDRLEPRGQRLLQLVADIAAFAVASLLLWFMAKTVMRSLERGTVSASIAQVPQWIPEATVLIGIAVFWLCAMSCLFARFARKVSGS